MLTATESNDPLIGGLIGHYRILRRLGAGGMGVVYEALHERINQRAAVKVLAPGRAGKTAHLQGLFAEARAASMIDHPGLVKIFDCGELPGGESYILMEYLGGEPLGARLRRAPDRRLPIAEALRIGRQVAAALRAAHEAGIVHRDLKPENLIIVADAEAPGGERAKLLDFGIAKFLNTVETQTSKRVILGTLAYMSPEQCRGDAEIDGRADVYALGVMLYEMLAGRTPFQGDPMALLKQHLYQDPPSLMGALQDAPQALADLLGRMLAKDREARPPMAQVVETLRALEQTRPQGPDGGTARQGAVLDPARGPARSAPDIAPSPSTLGSSDGRLDLAWSQRKARRVATTAALFAMLLVFAGGIFIDVARKGARKEAGKGRSPGLQQVRREVNSLAVFLSGDGPDDQSIAALRDGIAESITDSLAQLPGLRVMAQSTVLPYRGRNVLPSKIGIDLRVDAVVMGRVFQRGDLLTIAVELVKTADGSRLWGERYDRTVSDIFAVQQEITNRIVERLRIKLTDRERQRIEKHYTDNVDAYRAYLKGRLHLSDYSHDHVQKSIAYFRQAIEIDPNYALAYSGLADSYYMLSNLMLPANEAMPKVQAAAGQALEIDDTLAEAHNSMALVKALYDWDWDGAEFEFKKAIELNPSYAEAHRGYGFHLASMGRFDAALAELKLAQEMDPLSLSINASIAIPLYFAHRYQEAIDRMRAIIATDPNFYLSHSLLGVALEQTGDLSQAIRELEKALQLEDTTEMRAALGHVYALSGNEAKTRVTLADLLALSKGRFVSAHSIALLHMGLGDKEQALQWLQKALAERAEMLPYLPFDPRFDSLHSDLRFNDLLRRMRLPPSAMTTGSPR